MKKHFATGQASLTRSGVLGHYARTLVASVNREPHSIGYADRRELAATELLTPLFAPSLEVRLAELDLG